MGGVHETTKSRLRRELGTRRARVQPAVLANAAAAIGRALTAAPLFGEARHVVAYSARCGEIDPEPVAAAARDRGVPTYYPRVSGDRLSFRAACPWELAPGAYGILEPPAGAEELRRGGGPVLVLVPGLAFDWHGGRLGSGHGYYDRALGGLPRALRVGLALHEFVLERLPGDAWDVPMHMVATERGLFATDESVGIDPGDGSWNPSHS